MNTPIFDQLALELTIRDAEQDPQGRALVRNIQDRHADQCARHGHHVPGATVQIQPAAPRPGVLGLMFGWVRGE
jgi:hypothetical protein